MRRIFTIASAAALIVGLLASSALAETAAERRQRLCEEMGQAEGVVATYVPGEPVNVNNDRCEVVSTATTKTEAEEQVNNERAKRAVVRTVTTTSTVTTTQLYKWQTSGGGSWIADGDAYTGDALLTYEECLITPGIAKCA
jgi:hypothetical protein